MKANNLFQFVFSLVFILSLTSCTQENDLNQPNDESSFEILPLVQNKNLSYLENYKISNQTTSIDIANDKINLEIPTSKGDFKHISTYNISSDNNAAILYIISRNSTEVVVDQPTKFIIKDQLSISELGLDTKMLQNGNGLRIFVMNRNKDIDTNSTLFNCLMDKVENNDFKTVCTSANRNDEGGPDFYGDEVIMY